MSASRLSELGAILPGADMTRCPRCTYKGRKIPAGLSRKTGRPYDEFWTCGSCTTTWKSPRQWDFLHSLPPLTGTITKPKPLPQPVNALQPRSHPNWVYREAARIHSHLDS